MMKHRIRRFVMLAGGVLLPRISTRVWQISVAKTLDAVRLHQLENHLALGQLSFDAFCAELAKLTQGTDINWKSDLPLRMVPNDAMRPILDILSKEFELVLLSDYPAAWGDPIIPSASFANYFDQIVYMAQAGPYSDYDAVFAHLIGNNTMRPGSTVLVDWHSLRTRSALNAGLDAAIFVDTARFYRDLGLWGIVPLLDINTIRNSTLFQAHVTGDTQG